MIAAAHVAAGAVAGLASTYATRHRAGRVALAVGLGYLSHIALDTIPHSDYAMLSSTRDVLLVVLGEIIAACAVVGFIGRRRFAPGWSGYTWAAVAAALMPDVKFVTPFLSPLVMSQEAARQVTRYAYWFHGRWHAGPPSTPMDGLRTEVLCTLGLLVLLAILPVRRVAAQARVLMPRRRRHHR